jgi:hypothetical protein
MRQAPEDRAFIAKTLEAHRPAISFWEYNSANSV